ncbi:MAG: DNA-processing protein DprA, partial [Aestuariivirgaceae bacterium]
ELSVRGGLKRTLRIYPRANAERDLSAAAAIGARFVALTEPDYPQLLRHAGYPPPLVCLKGRPETLAAPTLAIVGSRNASAAGRKFTRQIAAELGRHGYTIISGLARGIDTAAHQAALETGTIAVLAGGLDVIYPPENAPLQEAIAEQGLLVSEMTPGTQPKAEFFPRRNRLISGMSRGVIVIEAAMRSGSLITARLAGEQGREVFAVPGSPLDPRAAGTNKLIKDGATLVSRVDDILDVVTTLPAIAATGEFEPHQDTDDGDAGADTASKDRANIVSLLGPSPVEINDLIRESGCSAQTVASILLELEIAGRLNRHGGQRISIL